MQMIITTIFSLGVGLAATDKPKALKRDYIYILEKRVSGIYLYLL